MIVVKVIRRGAKNSRVLLKNGNSRLIETAKLPFYLPIEAVEEEKVEEPIEVTQE